MSEAAAADHVELDLLDRATIRKRTRNVCIAALVVAAAFGGIVGLLAGPAGFGIAVVVVAVPLLLLAFSESRKTAWMSGSRVSMRAIGTRVVDLHAAKRLDVVVTDMRGMRTVSLLASGPPNDKAITVALAMYAGTGGRELGVYALRRIAESTAAAYGCTAEFSYEEGPDAVINDAAPLVLPEQAIVVTRILEAIYESAASGHEVVID